MQLEFDPEVPVREVRLTLTVDELEIFWGSLRETLEAVDEHEFQTRVGFGSQEVRRLQAELARLMNTLPYVPE
ncbi:uncharacterized small protein (DUF1192 family) [Arthrobacter bambusae]|uniref:Uncharacterized small protein (DUF1192 family) n=1 Tax=Arthrobacter bambusae TaxID=1338426 RepID=A0ABV2P446_9MICC